MYEKRVNTKQKPSLALESNSSADKDNLSRHSRGWWK